MRMEGFVTSGHTNRGDSNEKPRKRRVNSRIYMGNTAADGLTQGFIWGKTKIRGNDGLTQRFIWDGRVSIPIWRFLTGSHTNGRVSHW